MAAIVALRHWGNRRIMLQRCYAHPRNGAGMISLLMSEADTVDPHSARTIYYRVIGQPYNSVPVPKSLGSQEGLLGNLNWDMYRGGEQVADKVEGLSLASSRLDGSGRCGRGSGVTWSGP